MQVRDVDARDFEAVHRLLSANGWAQRVGTLADLGQLISALSVRSLA